MKCVEINPVGNFEHWDLEKIKELRDESEINVSLGQKLLFENSTSRLWDLTLWPSQRIPFRRHEFPHSIICMTNGLAISRFGTGKINLVQFEEGDTEFLEPNEDNAIYDLENIGESIIKLFVLEMRHRKTVFA
ncbi:MAG: hypothetical protein AAFU57_07630 [Bacteroidota bacterium]